MYEMVNFADALRGAGLREIGRARGWERGRKWAKWASKAKSPVAKTGLDAGILPALSG